MNLPRLPRVKTRTKVFIVLFGIFLLWTLTPPVPAFFVSLFLLFVSFRIDPKILGAVAILLLVSIPLLQYFEMNDRAEEVAVYVYFLLVTIVVLQILSTRKENTGEWIGQDKSPAKKKVDPIVVPERITYTKGGVTYVKKTEPKRPTHPHVVKEVKSQIIRDIEKNERIPPHRLAEKDEMPNDDNGIPLHLSLPERLKALSEMKRAQLQTVKPTLEDLNKLKVESDKLQADREMRTRNPRSDTKAIQNDWD